MSIDKDEIKNNLPIEKIEDLIADLGGEPRRQGNLLVCKTICHNGESHKLYYYDNTKLFKCYTECNETFDIFELIIKIKKNNNENWSLYDAIIFIINYFSLNINTFDKPSKLEDWKILSDWEKRNSTQQESKIIEIKTYNDSILKNFPRPHILPWEREGITKDICDEYGICYNPSSEAILIPHYNINNELIGIRERTLIKDNEIYGKYRPAVINNIMYNHPLGYNLYNINKVFQNVQKLQKVFIFEGEKSCLHYASLFGANNDISVACCGSNILTYQINLLLSLKVKEIIISFDKQFQDIGDIEWKQWTNKLINFNHKYNKYVKISFLFDKEKLLDYKDSPIDKGKDIFLYLYNHRIFL